MSETRPVEPAPVPGRIPAAEASGHEPRKRTQRFRRAANAVSLSPDQRQRQAEAMAFAWKALGGRDAVMQFFNTHSDALGGRPLDLAVDSDEGLARVMDALS